MRKNRLGYGAILILVAACLLSGCTWGSKEQGEDKETGAFHTSKMEKGNYQIEIYTEGLGHPTPDSDFETDFEWNHTEETKTSVLVSYRFIQNDMAQDFTNIDEMDKVTIDNKEMNYFSESETKLCLLYQFYDDLYLKMDLEEMSSFNMASGDSIEFSGNMTELLSDSDFLNFFQITVEDVK